MVVVVMGIVSRCHWMGISIALLIRMIKRVVFYFINKKL